MSHDPYRVALELREQLASEERRLGFFFGAGTSMAVGIPGIVDLTTKVEMKIGGAFKNTYAAIKGDLPPEPNVEQILDRLRLYRELIGNSDDKEYLGIKGKAGAKELDRTICSAISGLVQEPPKNNTQQPHKTFAQWIHALHARRDYPLELFTTNYD